LPATVMGLPPFGGDPRQPQGAVSSFCADPSSGPIQEPLLTPSLSVLLKSVPPSSTTTSNFSLASAAPPAVFSSDSCRPFSYLGRQSFGDPICLGGTGSGNGLLAAMASLNAERLLQQAAFSHRSAAAGAANVESGHSRYLQRSHHVLHRLSHPASPLPPATSPVAGLNSSSSVSSPPQAAGDADDDAAALPSRSLLRHRTEPFRPNSGLSDEHSSCRNLQNVSLY
jgi:hypothetical protein